MSEEAVECSSPYPVEPAPERSKQPRASLFINVAPPRMALNRPSAINNANLDLLKSEVSVENTTSLEIPSSPSSRRKSVMENKPSEFRLEASPHSPLLLRRKSMNTPQTPTLNSKPSDKYVSSPLLSPMKMMSYSKNGLSEMTLDCPSPRIKDAHAAQEV